MRIIGCIVRHAARRAARQTLAGRLIDRDCPERGRFLPHDVTMLLDRAWTEQNQLVREANLDRLPTRGSRHNVFLALLTISAFHALIERRVERVYAMELVTDVGWKLYVRFLAIPKLAARLLCRDPQARVNLVIRMFMVYPFRASGRPGYECRAWKEHDRFCTFWTHCPPLEAVREFVARHGNRGEVDAFRRSWCSFDWALANAIADGGFGEAGHYERPHTLSAGDDVCDMCWYAGPAPSKSTPNPQALPLAP
jgi:hypothetical protein